MLQKKARKSIYYSIFLITVCPLQALLLVIHLRTCDSSTLKYFAAADTEINSEVSFVSLFVTNTGLAFLLFNVLFLMVSRLSFLPRLASRIRCLEGSVCLIEAVYTSGC